MFKRLLLVALSLVLTACGASRFAVSVPAPALSSPPAAVVDDRPKLSVEGGKPGFFATLYYLGDKTFAPAKVDLFRGAVAAASAQTPASVTLHRFDVVDSHANRIRRAQAAGAAGVSYAAAIGIDSAPYSSDFIACVIDATVDGRRIQASATATYQMAFSSMTVYTDASYVAAVTSAIGDALRQWVSKASTPTP